MIIKNSLVCHAGTACAAVQSLTVELETLPGRNLLLRYELTGDAGQLRIPAPLPPVMADGLWEHTCFEAFIAVEGDAAYHEFNFSPSGQWAAYAFSDYRVRRQWTAGRAPCINCVQTNEGFRLEALIATVDLPTNPRNKPFQLGLTAVLETVDGSLSYWALRHPNMHPDFHHRGGFVQTMDTAIWS